MEITEKKLENKVENKVEKKVIKTVFEEKDNLSRQKFIIFALINAISFAYFITNIFRVKIAFLFFITILVSTSIYYLKESNLIKNKKAFYYLIPIGLITIANTIFYNNTFLNITSVLLLLNVFYVKLVNLNFKNVYGFKLIINNFEKLFRPEVTKSIIKADKESKNVVLFKKIFTGLIIAVIPFTIIFTLLISSDVVFEKMIINLIKDFEIGDMAVRIFRGGIFYFIVQYIFLNYIASSNDKEAENKQYKGDNVIITTVLSSFNLLFLIFCFIQLKYLFFHNGDNIINHLGKTINYANYAREGFFQLLFVTVINYSIIIMLFSKYKKELSNRLVKFMTTLLSIFTIILIFSSFYRMSLYCQNFGLTTLRIQVIIFLTLELLVVVATMFYLFKANYSISKLVFTVVLLGAVLNSYLANDYLSAKYNFAGGENVFDITDYNLSYDNYEIYKEHFGNEINIPYRMDMHDSWEEMSYFEYKYYNEQN